MSARDRLVWQEGSRRCSSCRKTAPGLIPEGWTILPSDDDRTATGERACCPDCCGIPIEMGQVYASTAPIDVRNHVRQCRRVVGVDWRNYLVWMRTDDVIRVRPPVVLRMSGGDPRTIPGHRLVSS